MLLMVSQSIEDLLARARTGDRDAAGSLLRRHRPYLKLIAQRSLDARVVVRVDPSDIVQQACLEAYRDLPAFRGASEGEWIAWLRRILQNTIAQTVEQHVLTQKRAVHRERSLEALLEPGRPLGEFVELEGSSPSQRVLRGEAAVRLAEAIAMLPQDQAEAIRLRHLEGWTLERLAGHFGRSEAAVAGLLKRGLRKLRGHLQHVSE